MRNRPAQDGTRRESRSLSLSVHLSLILSYHSGPGNGHIYTLFVSYLAANNIKNATINCSETVISVGGWNASHQFLLLLLLLVLVTARSRFCTDWNLPPDIRIGIYAYKLRIRRVLFVVVVVVMYVSWCASHNQHCRIYFHGCWWWMQKPPYIVVFLCTYHNPTSNSYLIPDELK